MPPPQHEDQGQQEGDHADEHAEVQQACCQGGMVDRGVRRRLCPDVQEDHHDGERDLQAAHQRRDQQNPTVRPFLMHGRPLVARQNERVRPVGGVGPVCQPG